MSLKKPYRLSRPADPLNWIGGAVSEWEVFARQGNQKIGVVAQDKVEFAESEKYQQLWHAWQLYDLNDPKKTIEVKKLPEAMPMMYATREDALEALWGEFEFDQVLAKEKKETR